MITIKPFQAIRPNTDVVEDVSSLPYDVFSLEEAREYVKDKPLSFLNIDVPETLFPVDYTFKDLEKYEKARDVLNKQINDGIYIQDESKCFYIYELTMDHKPQTGLVALSSIDDYMNNVIKKHENTVASKEIDRINHVDVLSAQTGPIFLTYRHDDTILKIMNDTKKNTPLYDFTTEDEITHRVWIINDTEAILKLIEAFKHIDYTYIADGHHRVASAIKAGLKRRQEHPNYTGEEEFNGFLSVLFPDNQLRILDYNRFVKDLNGYTKEEFIDQISKKFDVIKYKKRHPSKKTNIMMYIGEWYLLKPHKDILKEDVIGSLDVSLLQNEILSPILDIKDPRTNDRISFVGGIRGLGELERLVNQKENSVAFSMYPTSIQELLDVADASLLMPPKSTWFEPKLRSGIFIHKIEE